MRADIEKIIFDFRQALYQKLKHVKHGDTLQMDYVADREHDVIARTSGTSNTAKGTHASVYRVASNGVACPNDMFTEGTMHVASRGKCL